MRSLKALLSKKVALTAAAISVVSIAAFTGETWPWPGVWSSNETSGGPA